MKKYKLKELLTIKNGKDHKELPDGKFPVYGSGGLMRYVNEFLYDKESILLPRKGTLSNIQYVNTPFWTVDTLYYTVVDTKKVNTFYLYYLIKQFDLSKLNTGTGVPSMTFDAYYDLEVCIPDILMQNRIADILKSLDSKIALNNRINVELEAMAKTVYDYWFVQFDFPFDFAQGKPSAEGKPYKSSGGKMVWSEELKREVPEGWEVGTLSDLGDIVGGSTPPREVAGYFCNNGTAWITPKDLSLNQGNKFISKGELDVSESGIKAASLNIMSKGTILLSSRAPIGYLAISRDEVTTNQGFKSFVPNKGYSTEYVYYSIKNMIPTIENNAVGSTFKEVSASTLKSIKVCLAQKEIVEAYNKKVTAIFNRQNLLEQENQQLSSLRDWLLPMLMNGQVKVGEVEEEGGLMAAEPKEKYGK
ncbi:MAG: restriction endonuclease subunit S [Paludibacter sp.]|nr:restriction endonuclease subunit S [Paludibacter sp.]